MNNMNFPFICPTCMEVYTQKGLCIRITGQIKVCMDCRQENTFVAERCSNCMSQYLSLRNAICGQMVMSRMEQNA